MIYKECPECESAHLTDHWASQGKLRQFCNDCSWEAEPRIPEQREIITTKTISVNQFSGYCYTVYDRYGHVMIYSRTFGDEKQAEQDLLHTLECGKRDIHRGPYTGILWPSVVTVEGKLYT